MAGALDGALGGAALRSSTRQLSRAPGPGQRRQRPARRPQADSAVQPTRANMTVMARPRLPTPLQRQQTMTRIDPRPRSFIEAARVEWLLSD